MGFFKRNINENNKKRKLPATGNTRKGKFLQQKGKNERKFEDEEIPSDDEGEERSIDLNQSTEENLNEIEQTEENDTQYEDNQTLTFREAKKLVESIEISSASQDLDDFEGITEPLESQQKRKEELKSVQAHQKIADSIKIDEKNSFSYRPHKLSPICVCFSHSGNFIVSCSKDGSIIKYDLKKRCRVGVLSSILSKNKNNLKLKCSHVANENLHRGRVLCCEISPNDQFLVTGGSDNLIKIWDFEKLVFIKDFDGHRGPVNSLRFRQKCDSIELFSASTDRSIIVWNMDEMGLMNRLYGHQDVIEQLDILQWPRVLSCGGMDKSCRLFKVIEESHLVFNGFTDCISIDCVALINEEHFISGSADGSLYIWSMSRKKPVFVKRKAHGFHSMPQIQNSNNEIDVDLMKDLNTRKANKSVGEPRWICSVAALPYTDLVASGSSDGFLRLWRVGQDWKSLDQIAQFNMPGFINDIRFSYNGCYIVCAVGQEHKRGRWWTLKEAKNRIMVIYLQKDFEMREIMGGDGGESIELDEPNVGREGENEMRE
uniref:Uncharacterized protein n=1 Tax=Meloidogyne enterolobii TaxID=390850 RepID=A0A6V7TIZ9_MELEN|nr:unnamed protein product [Meloidogyne enterolobii]